MSFQFLFGDDRSIYAVGFSGALLWYRDLLRNGNNGEDGERGWAPNSGNQIDSGWNGLEHVFCGGDGIIYAIRESGELLWFKDLLRDGSNGLNGERGWAPNSGKQIGVGWNGLKQVFCGGDGIIYAVRDSGELLWFKDLLRDGSNGANGERGWSPDSGSQIGFGWNGFEHVFGGDNGIIYATGNGDLRWFQDLFRDGSNAADGSSGWAGNSSHVIGGAWGNIQQVFSAGGGVIYANEYNDLFFSLDERQDGQEGEFVDPGNRIGIERRVTIGTSRFEMIRGSDYVRVGLSWWGLRLEPGSAAPASPPRLVARSDEATVTLTFPPQILSEPAMTPGARLALETHRSLPGAVQFSVRAGTAIELNLQSVLDVLGSAGEVVTIGPLGELTTAIEIPWHLLVSVAPRSGALAQADHVTVPVTSPAGVTGLWHTRLVADDGNDTDARLWLVPVQVGDSDGIETPLTDGDRTKILAETTDGDGFPELRRLELSALGGSLSLHASWPGFEWDHEVVVGRDQHVRTQLTGMLYPFGLGAVTTTITDRVFPQDAPPAPSIAALISKSTLLISRPVAALFDRGFPFREAEITARRYDIDPPQDRPFVPMVEGKPLLLPVRCAGAQGDLILHMPLVFVDDLADQADAARRLWEQFSSITVPGVPIDMVRAGANRQAGDVHEVHGIKIAAALDDDGVHPTLDQFTVALPALRALMANTASEAGMVALRYTQEFLTGGSIPDLAFAPVAAAVPIDFTDRPDRSGGLMAPKFVADTLSRTLGPVPRGAITGAVPLSSIYAGATLLGLPLADLLDVASPPGAPTIIPLTNPAGAKMIWKDLALKDHGPLKTSPATKATLTVEKSADKSEITGQVVHFQLLVPEPPAETLVTLTFGALTFTQTGGHAPDLRVDGFDIKFGGELALVQTLVDKLLPLLRGTPAPGTSPALDHLAADPAPAGPGLTIRTDPSGLTASFSASIDEVPAGMFLMRNVAAHIGAVIPFSRDPITVSLGFASRDNPFSLSVMTFGGGGYVDITLGGMTKLEASLDFGAVVAVDFVVASAEVHALGGVHFLQNGSSITFEAFIRLGGSVEILHVVFISVDLLVMLDFVSTPTGTELDGRATLVIEVDLTLFSESVTIDSGTWRIAGSAHAFSPFHRASLDDGLANLLEYYEAFCT